MDSVKEIITAEERAEKEINDARNEGREAISSAKEAVSQNIERVKKELAEKSSQNRNEEKGVLNNLYREALADGEKSAQVLRETYSKKKQKAVDFLVDELTK